MKNKKKNNGGFPRSLLIIWICIFMLGFFNRAPVLGLICLLALVYVVFMWPIHEQVLTRAGKRDKISDIEYEAYVAAIGGYKDTPTSYIAEQMGIAEEKAIRDLIRLMDRRYFPGAYFDDHGNFIVPKNRKVRDDIKAEHYEKRMKCPKCGKNNPLSNAFCYYCGISLESAKEASRIREESVSKIHKVSEALPKGASRENIERIGTLTDEILGMLEADPEKNEAFSKFREYYLPKTISAIEYYGKLSDMD
ncbi:MAG: zinc ribbon domain-containing protein, partial [Firmicutes bacterium]|nr:zinc ribbon domain-containing protein [Bacillota bacterium]